MKVLCLLFLFMTLLFSDNNLKTIAFAQDTMANDFRKEQVLEAKREAEKIKNIKFVYSDANGQTSMLIRQIEKFIQDKVDVLIIGTNDEEAVVPVISKAMEQGISVVILDRGVKTENYTSFIHSDNTNIGKMAAEYIVKKLNGKGKVLLFEGLPKADVTYLRTKGFMDEISKYKDIEVIKRTGNYLRKDAIKETEDLIKNNIAVDAIFSESDSMLSGVRSANEKYGIDSSKVVMIGCDYITEAKNAIIEGTQTASILFPLGGIESIQTAIKIINKEKVEKHINIPTKLVTKENVQIVKPVF